eukprot:jgi/Chrzof1/4951/Cz15g06030.t1
MTGHLAVADTPVDVRLQSHVMDPHRYNLLLMKPTDDHIAALCMQQPQHAGVHVGQPQALHGIELEQWQQQQQQQGNGSSMQTSDVTRQGSSSSYKVKMWQCIPMSSQQPLQDGAVLLGGSCS